MYIDGKTGLVCYYDGTTNTNQNYTPLFKAMLPVRYNGEQITGEEFRLIKNNFCKNHKTSEIKSEFPWILKNVYTTAVIYYRDQRGTMTTYKKDCYGDYVTVIHFDNSKISEDIIMINETDVPVPVFRDIFHKTVDKYLIAKGVDIQINSDISLYNRIKKMAREKHITKEQLILRAVKQYLKQNEKNG